MLSLFYLIDTVNVTNLFSVHIKNIIKTKISVIVKRQIAVFKNLKPMMGSEFKWIKTIRLKMHMVWKRRLSARKKWWRHNHGVCTWNRDASP